MQITKLRRSQSTDKKFHLSKIESLLKSKSKRYFKKSYFATNKK